jgi:hypothetical protein
VGPEEEMGAVTASGTATAVAAVDASPQTPLKKVSLQDLPSEIHFKIFESLSPKDIGLPLLVGL